MKFRPNFYLTILISLAFLTCIDGQSFEDCNSRFRDLNLPVVLINEVYNGNAQLGEEYVEILIVGEQQDEGTFVFSAFDIIVDDNNDPSNGGRGTEPGFIVIKSQCLAQATPGDLILVYGEGITPDLDGIDFAFSIADPCLKRIEQSYNAGFHLSYTTGYPYYNTRIQWRHLLPIRDGGDIVQLRDSEGQIDVLETSEIQNYSLDLISNPGLVELPNSPGLPNSDENFSLIQYLKNEDIFNVLTESFDGNSLLVTIQGGLSPFTFESENFGASQIVTIDDHTFQINNLDCGEKQFMVLDQSGCEYDVTVMVEDLSTLNYYACVGESVILDANSCNGASSCFSWKNQNGVEEANLESENYSFIAEEDVEITLESSDGKGNIVSTISYNIYVTSEDSDGDGICDNQDTSPFDPCVPEGIDSDGDGVCDDLDACPDDAAVRAVIGDPCDDGNAATLNDRFASECDCQGEIDPNNPCGSQDIDGDGICDDVDDFPDDDCNGFEVKISGDISLCLNENETELFVDFLGGSPPYTISWSPTSSSASIIVSYDLHQEVSVDVSDSKGCSASAYVVLEKYESSDLDGDGRCDDEPCPNLEIGDYTHTFPNVHELDQPVFRSNSSPCSLDCDPTFSEADIIDICVKEYSKIKFADPESCIDLQDLSALESIIERLKAVAAEANLPQPTKAFVIVTSDDNLDDCGCGLEEDIEQEFMDNDEFAIGAWIKLERFNDGYVTTISYKDPSLSEIAEVFPDCGYDLSIVPDGPKIHHSQLLALGEDFAPRPQNIVGLNFPNQRIGVQDFGGLSDAQLHILEKNVQIAQTRFQTNVQFIVSNHFTQLGAEGYMRPSAEYAREALNSSNSDITFWVHFHEDNSASFEVKVNSIQKEPGNPMELSDEAIKEQITENVEFAAQQDMAVITKVANLGLAASDEEVLGNSNEWHFGIRSGAESETDELNFWGLAKEIAGISKKSVFKGQVAQELWKDGEYTSGSATLSLFDVPSGPCGILDGAVEANPIAGALQMLDLGKTLYKDPKAREGICKVISTPIKSGRHILNEEWNNLSGNSGKTEQHYAISKSIVVTVIAAVTGSGVFALIKKFGKKTDDVADGISDVMKDFPDDASSDFLSNMKDLFPDQADVEEILEMMGELGKSGVKAKNLFLDNPEWLAIWKKYKVTPDLEIADLKKVMQEKLPFDKPEFFAEFKQAFIQKNGNGIFEIQDGLTGFLGDLNKVVDPEFAKLFRNKPGAVKAWEKLIDIPNIRVSVKSLETVSKWVDDGIELTFEAIQDGAKIINKNGDEVGELIKIGGDDVLAISDDFFVAAGTPKSFGTITVNSNTGEIFTNPGYIKNADGTIGFIEDVSSYGTQLIQNTIKQRGSLRGTLTGITKTQDAHHIIPVQLLKENDVVKKAVEAGFDFNKASNGMGIEKFVKATGQGRHGPHPQYTNQIRQYLNDWASQNPGFSAQAAMDELTDVVASVRNTINTTTTKLNDLPLGL